MSHDRVVMLALDNSDHSRRAFDFYVSNLYLHTDYLMMVHFIEANNFIPIKGEEPAVNVYTLSIEVKTDLQRAEEYGRKLGKEYIHLCKEHKINHKFFLHIGTKSPGEFLTGFAKEHGANLLVMGYRGMGTLRRTLLGSVSDYVLHHVHIPVCVVPAAKGEGNSKK